MAYIAQPSFLIAPDSSGHQFYSARLFTLVFRSYAAAACQAARTAVICSGSGLAGEPPEMRA